MHIAMKALWRLIETETQEKPLTVYENGDGGFCYYLPSYGFKLSVRYHPQSSLANDHGDSIQHELHEVNLELLKGNKRIKVFSCIVFNDKVGAMARRLAFNIFGEVDRFELMALDF